ncbi:MAG TPA: aldehyde dehydrogenase family protein [Polyangiaceae bacterium]|nr:aldehyde dehydrogenase family protein [Polyangiaceae bacterium]
MQRYRIKIGGKPADSSQVELVHSPFDGAPVAEVGVADETHAEAAIVSSIAGFETLRHSPSYVRAEILERIASGIRAREREFASLICAESGKPIRYARGEVARAITTFTLGAAEARTLSGELLPVDQGAGLEGRLCMYRRVPRGPVLGISPFNFPLNLVAHKLAPALAVGCSLLLKPAAQAPLTAHLLSDVVDEAGAPPGAFNVVHCPPSIGERLVLDPRLPVLSFTGSDALGWRLKGLVPRKQAVLELGGNAPCLVDADVELAAILPRLSESAWASAGQVCIKAQRFFVHERVFEQFVEGFLAETARVAVGDPGDEKTMVGPLIEARHVERVLEWVDEARRAGARVLTGGRAERQIVFPTVVTDTRPGMRVADAEVFGPVTVVERARDMEHAFELANASRFGLQASLYTRDLGTALRAYERLEYGGVLVNDPTTFRVDNYPYGGTKESGFGREGVRFAMEEFSEPKLLSLRAL